MLQFYSSSSSTEMSCTLSRASHSLSFSARSLRFVLRAVPNTEFQNAGNSSKKCCLARSESVCPLPSRSASSFVQPLRKLVRWSSTAALHLVPTSSPLLYTMSDIDLDSTCVLPRLRPMHPHAHSSLSSLSQDWRRHSRLVPHHLPHISNQRPSLQHLPPEKPRRAALEASGA